MFFGGNQCFEGTFRLQVKEGSWPYQVPPNSLEYVLQEPLRQELDWLHEQQRLVPLGVNNSLEWCNCFFLVPKANSKVQLT